MADNKLYDVLGVTRTASDNEIKKVSAFSEAIPYSRPATITTKRACVSQTPEKEIKTFS